MTDTEMINAEKPVLLPTLYRGDSLPRQVLGVDARHRGRTFADHYVTAGLLAKAADGARSRDLKRPLAQLVAIHVGYRPANEQETYAADHSPLISFSTEVTAAWHFLDRTERKTFARCRLDDATHFMWKLSNVRAQPISPGRFRFVYRASTKNVDRFLTERVGELLKGDLSKIPQAVATQIVHGHVQADTREHVAELIDVVTFLNAVDAARDAIAPEVLSQAREFGSRWAEWLVYPMDCDEGLQGFSSRFSLNESLDFHHFAREQRP